MKKRMRFLAAAVISFAMVTAFGQQGQQSQSGTQKEDRTGVQSEQSGQSGQQSGQGQSGTQSRQGQSGQSGTQSGTQSRQGQTGTQGQGMGSAEDRVRQEVLWMKSEFNLDAEKEARLHEVLLKYERQGTTGADAAKNKEEKEKEIKAIIGDDNYKIYKEKKMEKDKSKSGSSTAPTPQR